MLIIPAIDLRGGRCVRLRQGDYARETVFAADPAAMAERWAAEGARYLHIVDLDGARSGRPENGEAIRRIIAQAGVPCQLGGGFREIESIEEAFAWGIDRVVLGTRAILEPEWLESVSRRFPGRIALGIDARNGEVAVHGWREQAKLGVLDVARSARDLPVAAIIYTDIGKDGMLDGPDFETLAALVGQGSVPVIASGGVTTVKDVGRLAELGAAGCIIGRALYEGRIELSEVIKYEGQSHAALASPGQ